MGGKTGGAWGVARSWGKEGLFWGFYGFPGSGLLSMRRYQVSKEDQKKQKTAGGKIPSAGIVSLPDLLIILLSSVYINEDTG